MYSILLILLTSCFNHSNIDDVIIETKVKTTTEIKYAKGFSIDDSNDDFTLIKVNSIQSKFNFTDSIYISHSINFESKDKKVLPNKLNRLALQSSTYFSYISILNKLKLIVGLSGVQYFNSSYLTKKINKDSIQEIGINGSIQMESLLKTNPDLFLIFPFELDNQIQYNSKGIQTLLISEYLEQTPIARLEWIKLFGLILNEPQLANTYFNSVEKLYYSSVKEVDSTKTVFFNLPFKDNWNMPNSNSITTNLLADAGFNYIFSDTTNDNSIRSKETVWEKAMECEYWVIIASRPTSFSLQDLINEESIYAEFPAVKNKKVIFCNTSTTDYFTMGVVEPELMLLDLINVSNPNHNPKYFKLLK